MVDVIKLKVAILHLRPAVRINFTLRWRNSLKRKITGWFGFVCKKTRPVKSNDCFMLFYHHHFRKAPFSQCFSSTPEKTKSRRFQISPALRAFSKLPFSVFGVLNRTNKDAISYLFGVVWTLPHFQGNSCQIALSRLTPGFGNSMIVRKWP